MPAGKVPAAAPGPPEAASPEHGGGGLAAGSCAACAAAERWELTQTQAEVLGLRAPLCASWTEGAVPAALPGASLAGSGAGIGYCSEGRVMLPAPSGSQCFPRPCQAHRARRKQPTTLTEADSRKLVGYGSHCGAENVLGKPCVFLKKIYLRMYLKVRVRE